MPKTKATFTKDEIENVLRWQLDTINLAVERKMMTPHLVEFQKRILWDIARQFEIELTDEQPTEQPKDHQPPLEAKGESQSESPRLATAKVNDARH